MNIIDKSTSFEPTSSLHTHTVFEAELELQFGPVQHRGRDSLQLWAGEHRQIRAHAMTCCSARPLGRTQLYLNSICTRICIQFVCWDHLWVLRPLTQLLSASIAPLSGRMWLSSHQTWKFSGRSSLELENTRQFVDLRTIKWESFAFRFQKWKKHFDLWSKVTISLEYWSIALKRTR